VKNELGVRVTGISIRGYEFLIVTKVEGF